MPYDSHIVRAKGNLKLSYGVGPAEIGVASGGQVGRSVYGESMICEDQQYWGVLSHFVSFIPFPKISPRFGLF